jgi:hypothetical protein
MELESNEIEVSIYYYGQPRIGDELYAGFANTIIKDYWRFTHNKDVVPHVPPTINLGYKHSCREVFEDELGVMRICSDINCEDNNCSSQYSVTETNTEDHMTYLGQYLSCDSSIY